MKFSVARDELLRPLQMTHAVVERRQTLPILANVHLVVTDQVLRLTATDLEVELSCTAPLISGDAGVETTIPARKLLDLCRASPDGTRLDFSVSPDKVVIRADKARFALTSLAVQEFPSIDVSEDGVTLKVAEGELKRLFESVQFAMAQQDVRYYLNGMLLEVGPDRVRGVATDGHRMALADIDMQTGVAESARVIVPRKTIVELHRLLNEEKGEVKLRIGKNHCLFRRADVVFKSKLIDGTFPEYERVIPSSVAHTVTADRNQLKDVLGRVAIFSNEKYRAVRMALSEGAMNLVANNTENEEAEETLGVVYAGEAMEIGFNVGYLLDVLNTLTSESVELGVTNANSSCLLSAPGRRSPRYVIMPMRL